jgi:hypothetical protein
LIVWRTDTKGRIARQIPVVSPCGEGFYPNNNLSPARAV